MSGGHDFRQTFDHVTQLKLEIGLPHPTLPNMVRNSHGDLGAWGWITPVPNTVLVGGSDPLLPEGGVKYSSPAAAASTDYFYTEPMPVTAGQYVGAAAKVLVGTADTSSSMQVEFTNAAGGVISASAASASLTSSNPTTQLRNNGVLVPANAAWAQLKFRVTRSTTGTRIVLVREAMLVTAASSAATTNVAYRDHIDSWVNVIGPTHSIDVKRGGADGDPLDVGTLAARILDATIDPAVSTTIRPGRPVVLSVANGFTWEPLFTGQLVDVNVTYDLNRALRGDDKHAQIVLSAVDNVATLANRPMPYGVSDITHLRSVMEMGGVPWNINGNRDQLVDNILAVSYNDNSTMLDQITVTRDTNSGHAWVDRRGVLNTWDQSTLDGFIVFGKRNLFTGKNPSIEVADIAMYTAVNGTLLRVATPTIGAPYGASVLRYTATGSSGTGSNYLYTPASEAVTPGTTYTGSFSLRRWTNSDHRIMLRFYNSSGIPIAPDTVKIVPAAEISTTTFTRMWVTATAPAGAAFARVFAFASAALTAGQIFEVDGFLLTEGDEPLAFFENTVQQSFSERQYSEIDLGFSRKHLINVVTMRSLELDPVDPTKPAEKRYGPYRDERAIQEWGPATARDFTVNGLTESQVQALALNILIRNSRPSVRASSIRVPISTTSHIGQRSLLDLCNLVAIGCDPKKYTDTQRITGIEHHIDERGWVMVLHLAPGNSVSMPHATPSIR